MQLMQTDKNDMKVEKSVSMLSHAFDWPCKRQIVTDPKLRNASHILLEGDCEANLEITLVHHKSSPNNKSYLFSSFNEKNDRVAILHKNQDQPSSSSKTETENILEKTLIV